MKVLCTGMSGSGRTSYVRLVGEMAKQQGRPLHVFDVRDTMFHLARERGEELEEETILDVFPTALGAYRAAALERLSTQIKALPPEASWILVTHATFSWNYSIVPGLDVYYLNLLQPDAYVTITDGILSIHRRLTEERWSQMTINTLLWWRDVERAATEMMAAWQRKPHFLIGRRQGPETLYRLLFEPDVPTTYLSYPMSHLEGHETLMDLERFRQKLRQRMIVFDPAAVDDFTADEDAAIGFSDGSVQAHEIGSTLASAKLVDERLVDERLVDERLVDERLVDERLVDERGEVAPSHAAIPTPAATPAPPAGPNGANGHLSPTDQPRAPSRSAQAFTPGAFSGVGGMASKTGRARDLILDEHPAGDYGEGRPPNPENLDHIDGQIVDRDYKLLEQAQTVVVYYPTTTLSAGVICEMKQAIHLGKRVYALWLPDRPPSPFFTRYCTKWFRDAPALFSYLDHRR